MGRALVGLFRGDHRPALLLASVDVDSRSDDPKDHDVPSDKLSDAAHQVDSAFADIEEKVDDPTKEVEDSGDQGVDERGKGANDAGKKLVDGLEEVLEGGNEFGHLDCDEACRFRLDRRSLGCNSCEDVVFDS